MNKHNESGNILVELSLLLPVVVVVSIGIWALLTGDTTMLDLYNTIGDLFVTIGNMLGM